MSGAESAHNAGKYFFMPSEAEDVGQTEEREESICKT